MKSRLGLVAACAAFLTCGTAEVSAGIITEWTFQTPVSAPDNSPTPDIGTGVASVLGMTNNYLLTSGSTITGTGTFTGGTTVATESTASADVTSTTGGPNGESYAWRVRANGTNADSTTSGNGWALQAPQYTQGAQFSSSTAGYSNISFSFDWYSTTQGVLNLQEQYTLNGTTWININAPLTATSNGWSPSTLTINFSGISGRNNDPNFGVRLVSAYDTALTPNNYGSADGGQNGVYNNNSGNWRFADVSFSGTPLAATVPEPGSIVLTGLGALGVAIAAFRRKLARA